MTSVTFAVPDETKKEMKDISWINWSELAREEIQKKAKLESLLKKLKSKDEQELIKWSVELGRKVKKDRFKKLLAELSPEERKDLLK